MKKDWTIKISRWNSNKLQFDIEKRHVTENEIDYDAKDDEQVTTISVFTALHMVHIWIHKVRP